MSEIIALLQCLIALGAVAAAGIDRGLRRAVDGQAFLGLHRGAVVRHLDVWFS